MMTRRNRFLATCIAACLIPTAVSLAAPSPATYAAVVADPSRPAADTARDADRKPAAMLAFTKVAPGETVVDWVPGGGYFTRLFSSAVGLKGSVYAVTPDTFNRKYPPKGSPLSSEPGHGNVHAVVSNPDTALTLPTPVDLVWTAQNYHDIHIYFGGAAGTAAFNKAVFAALKPGGRYVILDHAGKPGLDEAGMSELHRIDEAQVKREVASAGFVLDGESMVVRNSADDHSKGVFDPTIRGHTDQFVLRFRKPG